MTESDSAQPAADAELPSRRRILRRAALASGAAVAGALITEAANATPARAADGDPVVAGEQTNAEASTVIFADGSGTAPYAHGGLLFTDTAFSGINNGSYQFAAVAGVALSPNTSGLVAGVVGMAESTGVVGIADLGVVGVGTAQGVRGVGPVGVVGEADTGGVGVEAYSRSGTALVVRGKAQFSTSGVAKIAKGRERVTVRLAHVTSKSMVLATLQTADGKVAVAHAIAAKGKFTITLTAPASKGVRVAWFVID